MKRSITLFLYTCLFGVLMAQGIEDDARQLYLNAKRNSIHQKWDDSISDFKALIQQFPGSRYVDESYFWIAYCVEKKGENPDLAFYSFEDLKDRFPASPWLDDAIIHQITLAEQLIKEGHANYTDFLITQLQSDVREFQEYAALALGRLGDRRALPVLKRMQKDDNWKTTVESVLETMKQAPEIPVASDSQEEEKPLSGGSYAKKPEPNFLHALGKLFKKANKLAPRHNIYRQLLQIEEDWTQNHLIDFGMWTILPNNLLHEYFSLKGYDREEWRRKYWKRRDPTPTTVVNELFDEFLTRITYAREHFSPTWDESIMTKDYVWDTKDPGHLWDQHLQEGLPHAPWDARGELYLKYGPPDFITNSGFHQQEWTYNRYLVDFIVTKMKTNIYGKAIEPGPMTQFINRRHNDRRIYSDFIDNPEFRYDFEYNVHAFKDLEITVIPPKRNDESNVQVHYTVPVGEFGTQQEKNGPVIRYIQRYVIFDEDMKEIRRDEIVKTLPKTRNDDLVLGTIKTRVDPGHYMFVLRIEDESTGKLCIFVETLNIIL